MRGKLYQDANMGNIYRYHYIGTKVFNDQTGFKDNFQVQQVKSVSILSYSGSFF